MENGKLNIPNDPVIHYIEGDGIGVDISPVMISVVDAAVEKAYDGARKIAWNEVLAGEKAFNVTGEWLPEATLDAMRSGLVSIKGPLTTPVGGGIRSSGNRIRLSIELTDASNGSVVWSNKYDRVLDDIFEIQDEIVRTITIQLLGEIEITSLQRSKRKPTENFSSYELLLRGKEQHHVFSKEANAKALAFFDKAIELDSGNAQAHAWKTCTLAQGMARGYIEGDPEPVQKAALDHLSMAHDLNENDFEVHRMLANVYLSNHDYAKAEEHGRKAFQLNPNDPRVLSDAGTILVRVGHDAEGLEMLHKALLLDPVPMGQSNSDNRYRDIVLGMFCAGDWQGCPQRAISHPASDDFESWAGRPFQIEKLQKKNNPVLQILLELKI